MKFQSNRFGLKGKSRSSEKKSEFSSLRRRFRALKRKVRMNGRFIILVALVTLCPACLKSISKPELGGKKPTSSDSPDKGSSAEEGASGETVRKGDVIPPPLSGSEVTRSIRAAESEALRLGSKNPSGCEKAGTAKAKGLGIYLNFEVLEDETPISVSLERLCGELDEKNEISLIRTDSNAIIKSQPLPTSEITQSTVILKPLTLKKGKYYVAIEVGGNTLPSLSSFLISGVAIDAEKNVRFEGLSDF